LLATLNYKDKNINVSLPIRVKLIKLKVFKCSNCKGEGTLKNIARYCEINSSKFEKYKTSYNDKAGQFFPLSVLDNKQEIPNCPKCFKRMKEAPKDLYKIYVSKRVEYVDKLRLLNRHTAFRWKKEESRRFVATNIVAYAGEFKNVIEGINWLKKSLPKKKNVKVSIKLEKIKKKDIKGAYELYEQRRMEKAI